MLCFFVFFSFCCFFAAWVCYIVIFSLFDLSAGWDHVPNSDSVLSVAWSIKLPTLRGGHLIFKCTSMIVP